jgi:hypothetical protein
MIGIRRPRPPWGLACASFVAASASSGRALAEVPVTAELEYDAARVADVCPDEAAFRRAVTQRLGRDPFVLDAPRKIAVSLRRTSSGYSAEVRTLDGTEERGRRRIEASGGCAEVASAAALAVSIAIDPLVLQRFEAPREPPTSAAERAPRAVSEPVRARPGLVAAPAPSQTRWEATLGGHVWAGAVPKLSVGPSLGVGVQSGSWALGLHAFGVLPREKPLEPTPLAVSAGLFGTAVAACGLAGAWRLCGVGEFGVLIARGHGVDHPLSDRTAHLAAGVAAGYSFRRGRFSVTPLLEGDVRLRQTTLVLDGKQVWQAPTLFGSLGIELGLTL